MRSSANADISDAAKAAGAISQAYGYRAVEKVGSRNILITIVIEISDGYALRTSTNADLSGAAKTA